MMEVLRVELVVLLANMPLVCLAIYTQFIRVHAATFQLVIMLHLMGVQRLLVMGLTAGVALLPTRPIHILCQVAKVIVLHHFNG